MGKASSGKKVARAAMTGGGRTARGKTPWGWYSAMAVVAILGTIVLIVSRSDTQERLAARGGEHPTTKEHWHTAYGFYYCDQFGPALADNERDPKGVHTHGDGVIHVHPFSQAASGKRAVTGVFFETMGITITSTRMDIADQKFSNGDKCGDKEGIVRVLVNGEEYKGDPAAIHFEDRQQIVFAFAPKDAEIPKTPPSAGELNSLSDVPGSPGATSSTSQVPQEGSTETTAGTVPPEGSSTTATTATTTP
jgi:hypothetical protein